MLTSLITLYCVEYHSYRCSIDPQRIWTIVESAGGSVHAAAVQGDLDFYVPERIISLVMLLDPALKINSRKSYI